MTQSDICAYCGEPIVFDAQAAGAWRHKSTDFQKCENHRIGDAPGVRVATPFLKPGAE